MSKYKPVKKKRTRRNLPKGANPGVFESKSSDLAASVVHNAVHMPDGSLPVLPSLTGQDQPLLAYVPRLAEECELYFPRFAQDHLVLLQQRRYIHSGELVELSSTVFGSTTLSKEEAISMLEEALERVKSGADFRIAKGDDEEADPLAFMAAPEAEDNTDNTADENEAKAEDEAEESEETEGDTEDE